MNIDDIKELILPVLIRHHVKRAGIFGSLAKGNLKPKSDVDILIELGKSISLMDFVRIKHELEDVLGRRVDLVEYQALKPRLKNRILAEEISIYGR